MKERAFFLHVHGEEEFYDSFGENLYGMGQRNVWTAAIDVSLRMLEPEW